MYLHLFWTNNAFISVLSQKRGTLIQEFRLPEEAYSPKGEDSDIDDPASRRRASRQSS